MSQFFINNTSAAPPPVVPTSFVTQNGTAVPAANILIVDGFDSVENNDNGIITKGGVVGTGTANEVDVVLTNRATGQVTTSNATVTTIITFSLGATAGLFTIFGYTSGFIPASNQGGSYDYVVSARTDGVTATEIGSEFAITFEDAIMAPSDILATVSGNNVLIQVMGVVGTTIHWDSKFEYRQVT